MKVYVYKNREERIGSFRTKGTNSLQEDLLNFANHNNNIKFEGGEILKCKNTKWKIIKECDSLIVEKCEDGGQSDKLANISFIIGTGVLLILVASNYSNVIESKSGVSVSWCIGFLISCLINWFSSRYWFGHLYFRIMGISDKQQIKEISNSQGMITGGRVGSFERLIYIYAIMSNTLNVLEAWIVLKAFFGWMDQQIERQNRRKNQYKESDRILNYYKYIVGNGLSMTAGILFGKLGIVISKLLSTVFDIS